MGESGCIRPMQQNQNKTGSRRRGNHGKQRGEEPNSPQPVASAAVKDASKRRYSYSAMSQIATSSGFKGGGKGNVEEAKSPLVKELEGFIEAAAEEDPISAATKEAIFEKCKGNVKALAYDSHGCRLLQSSFGMLEDDKMLKELVDELKGHILEASVNMHGNHVLQRAIDLLRPSDANSVFQELVTGPVSFTGDGWSEPWDATQIARSKYGCRVLERVIEHFLPAHEKCIEFLQPILKACKALCRDQYGNFIIQHLLEHGTKSHKDTIAAYVEENLEEFALDQHACSVVDKALSYTDLRDVLADKILKTEGLLAKMASNRSNTSVHRLLVMIGQDEKVERKEQRKAIAKEQLSSQAFKETKQGQDLLGKFFPEVVSVEDQASKSGRDRRNQVEQKSSIRP
mmetsp:Transcript_52867/g.83978  ORF Transcript_52867/g.83978 Transcript_52867/m.83978 type:complete len:400 (-) Transcript_52867:321-1520(-)